MVHRKCCVFMDESTFAVANDALRPLSHTHFTSDGIFDIYECASLKRTVCVNEE